MTGETNDTKADVSRESRPPGDPVRDLDEQDCTSPELEKLLAAIDGASHCSPEMLEWKLTFIFGQDLASLIRAVKAIDQKAVQQRVVHTLLREASQMLCLYRSACERLNRGRRPITDE